jgi:hypothetical protein
VVAAAVAALVVVVIIVSIIIEWFVVVVAGCVGDDKRSIGGDRAGEDGGGISSFSIGLRSMPLLLPNDDDDACRAANRRFRTSSGEVGPVEPPKLCPCCIPIVVTTPSNPPRLFWLRIEKGEKNRR